MHTRKAFLYFILPLVYLGLFVLCGMLFPVMISTRGSVADIVGRFLLMIFLLQLFMFSPFFSGCGIVGMVHEVKALRNQETKIKNIAMMTMSVLYIVAGIVFFCLLAYVVMTA